MKFIVDTGAAISIIPAKFINGINLNPTPVLLSTATGQNIHCHGEAILDIKIPNLRRSFTWNFIIADTTHPLLGLDFLHHHKILIDCYKKIMIDSSTAMTARLKKPKSSPINILINHVDNIPANIKEILDKFPSITRPNCPNIAKVNKSPNKNQIYHRIDTGSSPPVYAKPRRLSTEKCAVAKEEFRRLQHAGIVAPSNASWSSALHMVPKPDGSFRPCGDYRQLNTITIPDRYPIPNMSSLPSKLNNKKIFSKIDLVQAFHQIPVHPDDVPKTAITTEFGLFEFLYMPFGLRNSSATFQRYMDSIFSDLDCVFVYQDDILISSENEQQHIIDLTNVMSLLHNNNLKISLTKSVFLVDQIDFLGCSINGDGIKPTNSKINELKDFPYPDDSKSLRRFLGMVGFYRQLVPNFSCIVLPLTERIRLSPKEKSLQLSDTEKQSFDEIINTLSNIAPLPYPDSNVSHYQLVTDSSQFAIGAALHQMVDGNPIPIGFFSRKLSQAQTKYSAFDRELLAAYQSVLHFRHSIEGRHVILLTDHKPLCNAFKSPNPAKSDRQQRHLSILSEYVHDVVHIKGKDNIVADCLSRPTNSVTVDLCDIPEIARQQPNDPEINEYQSRLKSYVVNDNLNLLCDVSTPYPRPYIPLNLRKDIFNSLHSMCHSGVKSSLKLIKLRFFWPNMDKNIRQWCRECLECQQSKVIKHTKSPIDPFQLPSSRFQTIHVDIVGPLPPVKNTNDPYVSSYRYLLTCIDRATRWVEAYPLSEITASAVANAFVTSWISRFGVPLHVITDRGTQFESELFSELSKLIGFHRLRTTGYNPKANGMIERVHRTIKTAIKARKQSWLAALPIVLLGIRCIPNESGYSPFSAVTGTDILIPKPIISPLDEPIPFDQEALKTLSQEMSKLDLDFMSSGKSHNSNSRQYSHIPKDLSTCQKVWLRTDRVRKALEAPYTGPFDVIERNPKYFIINKNNNHLSVSIDRLKPVVLPSFNAPPIPSSSSSEPLSVHDDVTTDNVTPNDVIPSDVILSDVTPSDNISNDVIPNAVSDVISNEPSQDSVANSSSTTTRSGRRVTFNKDKRYYYF